MPLQGLKVFGRSEQVTTKGYQLFDASKIPTKTQGGATVTNNCDGSFTVSGNGNTTTTCSYETFYTPEQSKAMFKAGAVYIKNNSVGTVNVYCKFKNNQGLIGETGSKDKPFILTEEHVNSNGFMAGIGFYCAKDSLISNGIMKPMIYQNGDGTWEPFTGGKFSPSPEYPSPIESVGNKGDVEVEITGSNLCMGNLKAYFNNTSLIHEDGQSELFYFKCKKGQTYIYNSTVKGDRSTIAYTECVPRNGVKIFGKKEVYRKTFVSDNNGYCCIYVNSSRNDEIKKDFRVNAASEIMQYEPYREPQTLTFQTPNGLPGIKVVSGGNYTDSNGQQWVCDEIDLERGKYVQRIYAITFNGSENWYIHPKGNFYLDLKGTFDNKLSMGIFSNAVSQEGKTQFGATGVYFEKTEAFPTLSSFKEYLSNEQNKGNPVTAIMAIKTPIKNDLNQETIAAYRALHTNNPTTVISNDESADMELTYTVDTKTYVDKKIAEISTAIVQKGI